MLAFSTKTPVVIPVDEIYILIYCLITIRNNLEYVYANVGVMGQSLYTVICSMNFTVYFFFFISLRIISIGISQTYTAYKK